MPLLYSLFLVEVAMPISGRASGLLLQYYQVEQNLPPPPVEMVPMNCFDSASNGAAGVPSRPVSTFIAAVN